MYLIRSKNNLFETSLQAEKSSLNLLRNQYECLQKEFEKANRTIGDLNDVLKATQNEKNGVNLKNEENRRELNNLDVQLRRKEDTLQFATKQIDDLNNSCQILKGKLNEHDKKIQQQQNDIHGLNSALNAEKGLRLSLEKSNDQIETLLNEKDRENRKLYSDNSELRSQFDRTGTDNKILSNEIEKLKSHILVLTEQNQSVSFFFI